MKIKLLLIIMGMAVVVVYGILAILLVGVPGRSASPGGLTAKDAYPLALEKAQAWQTDAQLVSATASWRDLTAEQLLEEDASWGFTFFSPQTRQIKIISVTEAGAEGVESINVPPTVHIPDLTSWQVDSPQVLGLFLDRGGRDFLAQHPEATVSLRLGLEEGGEGLVWLAFGIDNTDRSTLTLQIDGNSGNVMGPTP